MIFLKWALVIFCISSSLSLESHTQTCDSKDLLALKEFRGSLKNGSIISSWLDDSICCQWDGVVCEGNGSVSSRVIQLILANKGLQGKILPSLGRLDQLKLLDLSCNHLQGGLPIELSNLQNLQVLDLSNNILAGPISMAVFNLKSVISINISSNMFDGELFDVTHTPNLAVLNISHNSFTGEVDSRICNPKIGIKILDLSMNHFRGGLQGLENCNKSLQYMNVDGNSLSGHLPDALFSMMALEHLSLSCNNFSGQLSKKLGKLYNLKTLVIFNNRISGPLPNAFWNLTKLELLIAHTNSFSGNLPSSLSHCSLLRVLDLRNNTLRGSIDLNFTKLTNLCTLDLATNHFTGTLPSTLSHCQELKILSLAKNKLTDQIPENFANLTSLLFLSLSNNSFVNLSRALSVLQQCKNLTTLILSKNFHGEEIARNVSGFKSLMIFALGNCALKGQIPVWLQTCRKLRVLDLSWNHLNGIIPTWIGKMENLFYLDLSNNTLVGEVPQSLSMLPSLDSEHCNLSDIVTSSGIPLYVKRNQSASGLQYNQVSSFPPSILLSNNKINGTILPGIGKLKLLHVLDLSRNNITGTIPSSIAEMRNLEILDLSFNNLHGTIPPSLTKLTFLSKFSVANNHLTGSIPNSNQFLSFPSSSFEGNIGLCGEINSPCVGGDVGYMVSKPKNVSTSSRSKIGPSSVIGITFCVGVGMAIIIAIVILGLSRRDAIGDLDGDMEDASAIHEGLYRGSKLVLFHSSDCENLTVADLLKSTSNFNQSNIIGCGGFGLVYKANFPNNRKAAIKRLSGDCGQMEREFQAEVEALSRAQHKNLVSLQGYCIHGNDRLLIYSYMENGSLDYWLHERVDGGSFLNWDTRLKIAQGAARGLTYLHKVCKPNIVHRDIKSSNILLDENFEASLADFGLSRLIRPYDTHVTTDLVGTLGYIPPEYCQTLSATFRGDVYSFGVVLLELLTGRRPVDICKGKHCQDLVSWVFQMKIEKKEEEIIDVLIWDKGVEKQFVEVLGVACQCLDQNPRRRPGIEQVVSWLDGVDAESCQ